MTASVESAAEVRDRFTAPGAEFEVAEEDVLGVQLPVFVHRYRSLGDALRASAARGPRDYLVTADRRISYAEHARRVGSALAIGSRRWPQQSRVDHRVLAGSVVRRERARLQPLVVSRGTHLRRRAHQPAMVTTDRKPAALLDASDHAGLSIEQYLPVLVAAYPAEPPLAATEVGADRPGDILYERHVRLGRKCVVHSDRNRTSVIEYHQINAELPTSARCSTACSSPAPVGPTDLIGPPGENGCLQPPRPCGPKHTDIPEGLVLRRPHEKLGQEIAAVMVVDPAEIMCACVEI